MHATSRFLLNLSASLVVIACGGSDVSQASSDGEVDDTTTTPLDDSGDPLKTDSGTPPVGDSGKPPTDSTPKPPAVGWLKTSGNAILNSDGTRFHGKGANIPDQRGCDACLGTPDPKEENRRIDELAAWGANFIRLGLESDAVKDDVLNNAGYLKDLQTVVLHAASKNIYVLMSLWIDATIDGSELPTATSNQAWQLIAKTFADEPHVLFGITNEPHGASDDAVWKAMNTSTQAIRDAEKSSGSQQHIVVVQGTQGYARDTSYYITHPITAGGGTNIAYETHPYNPQSDFDKLITTPAKSLPLIIGEFGPVNVGGSSVSVGGTPAVTVADCLALMTLARKLEVPHLAFTFHMRCPPNLLVDNSKGGCGLAMTLAPTSDWGVPFKAALSAPW